MSLNDLEQALFKAKWGSAEEDAVEVIARTLELSKEAVERVLYAAAVARNTCRDDYEHRTSRIIETMDEGSTLSDGLKNAITVHVQKGISRVVVRRAILEEASLLVPVAKLITDPADICSGCAHSIACIANSYSTPEACFTQGPPNSVHVHGDGSATLNRLGAGMALVFPVKIVKDTVSVTCTHPRGTYLVQALDLCL